MDRSSVQGWLDRYVAAWKSYDRAEIESLFASEATYRYHAPGTYDARYEPYAVDGDRAVAIGWSKYWTDESRSTLEKTYDNVFLLRFDDDGRCLEFTEYFMKRPDGR
jgi:hypothetical protein